MPEITFKIIVPEGTTIAVGGLEEVIAAAVAGAVAEPADTVERYWREYLSPNGRKVFGQAALWQLTYGPGFTLEELAEALSISYESIKSMHRSTGRTARRWRKDTGLSEPIKLIAGDYVPHPEREGWRTEYSLPEDVAERIRELDVAG